MVSARTAANTFSGDRSELLLALDDQFFPVYSAADTHWVTSLAAANTTFGDQLRLPRTPLEYPEMTIANVTLVSAETVANTLPVTYPGYYGPRGNKAFPSLTLLR